jgi:hypothetical protein
MSGSATVKCRLSVTIRLGGELRRSDFITRTAPMTQDPIQRARAFVASVTLPGPPAGSIRRMAVAFTAERAQATVVGSDVIAFAQGIDPSERDDIVSASLLAQLVAKKQEPAPATLDEVVRWYDAYFEVLSQIGFLIEDKSFVQYDTRSDSFEAHEAILEVAAALLAGSPGALVLVTRTLEALRRMSDDSPWITLFNRESQSANTARFQMSVVSQDDDRRLHEVVMSFGLEATTKVTQVLFFKFRSQTARLQHHSGRVAINAAVLAGIRDDVARKLSDHVREYVATLPEL